MVSSSDCSSFSIECEVLICDIIGLNSACSFELSFELLLTLSIALALSLALWQALSLALSLDFEAFAGTLWQSGLLGGAGRLANGKRTESVWNPCGIRVNRWRFAVDGGGLVWIV